MTPSGHWMTGECDYLRFFPLSGCPSSGGKEQSCQQATSLQTAVVVVEAELLLVMVFLEMSMLASDSYV